MKKEHTNDNLLKKHFQNQRRMDELSAPSFDLLFEKAQKKHIKMKRNKRLLIGILVLSVLSIGLYTRFQKGYDEAVNYEVAKASLNYYDILMKDGKIIFNDIQFDYDNASIRPSSMPIIKKIGEMLKDHPELQLSIEGHTDSDGSSTYNLKLSEARAQAVRSALLNMGIAASRLQAKGFGEEKPMVPNDSSNGKAKNRRVEIVRI
jgi:outer membrane protein OmpA-like peptidoglycan-associated protein